MKSWDYKAILEKLDYVNERLKSVRNQEERVTLYYDKLCFCTMLECLNKNYVKFYEASTIAMDYTIKLSQEQIMDGIITHNLLSRFESRVIPEDMEFSFEICKNLALQATEDFDDTMLYEEDPIKSAKKFIEILPNHPVKEKMYAILNDPDKILILDSLNENNSYDGICCSSKIFGENYIAIPNNVSILLHEVMHAVHEKETNFSHVGDHYLQSDEVLSYAMQYYYSLQTGQTDFKNQICCMARQIVADLVNDDITISNEEIKNADINSINNQDDIVKAESVLLKNKVISLCLAEKMIENPEEGFYYFYSLADTVFQKNEIPSFSSFGITEEEIKEKSLNFMGEAKITSSPKK